MTYEDFKAAAHEALIPKIGERFRIRTFGTLVNPPREWREAHEPPEYIVIQVTDSGLWPFEYSYLWSFDYSVIDVTPNSRGNVVGETGVVRGLSDWWESLNLLEITKWTTTTTEPKLSASST